jgi:hypothetical protein
MREHESVMVYSARVWQWTRRRLAPFVLFGAGLALAFLAGPLMPSSQSRASVMGTLLSLGATLLLVSCVILRVKVVEGKDISQYVAGLFQSFPLRGESNRGTWGFVGLEADNPLPPMRERAVDPAGLVPDRIQDLESRLSVVVEHVEALNRRLMNTNKLLHEYRTSHDAAVNELRRLIRDALGGGIGVELVAVGWLIVGFMLSSWAGLFG